MEELGSAVTSWGPKRKGTRAEAELARILWERGYAVIRGPSSGGGVRRRFQPDLVAMRDGRILVMEVKTIPRGDKPLYIESHKVLGMEEFARRAGATPLIAVRIRGGEWRFHPTESLEPTRGGNFKLSRPSSGLRLRDLDVLVRGGPRLTDYMGT